MTQFVKIPQVKGGFQYVRKDAVTSIVVTPKNNDSIDVHISSMGTTMHTNLEPAQVDRLLMLVQCDNADDVSDAEEIAPPIEFGGIMEGDFKFEHLMSLDSVYGGVGIAVGDSIDVEEGYLYKFVVNGKQVPPTTVLKNQDAVQYYSCKAA